jgi:hypothetical protein
MSPQVPERKAYKYAGIFGCSALFVVPTNGTKLRKAPQYEVPGSHRLHRLSPCSLAPLLLKTASASSLIPRQADSANCPVFYNSIAPGPVELQNALALNDVLKLGSGGSRKFGDVIFSIDARPVQAQGYIVVHLAKTGTSPLGQAIIVSYFEGRLPSGKATPSREWRVPVERGGQEVIVCLRIAPLGNGYWYASL